MIDRFCIAAMLSASQAVAQIATPLSVPASSSTPAVQTKPLAFEVATIKPGRPSGNWGFGFGFGPTGYSAAGVTLATLIYQAFFPSSSYTGGQDALIGAPIWVEKDTWDIQAKVATEDIAVYQQLTRFNVDTPVARQMLQTMLADRCKLVVHRVPAQMPAYALMIAKNGPKLTQAAPNEAQPSGSIPAPGGGFFVPRRRGGPLILTFSAASMSTLAQELRSLTGRSVVDRTGLTGTYDFTLTWLSVGPDEREGSISFDDPFPLSHWNLGALGLRVEQVQIPTEHLVIDHIEKPSEN